MRRSSGLYVPFSISLGSSSVSYPYHSTFLGFWCTLNTPYFFYLRTSVHTSPSSLTLSFLCPSVNSRNSAKFNSSLPHLKRAVTFSLDLRDDWFNDWQPAGREAPGRLGPSSLSFLLLCPCVRCDNWCVECEWIY